MSLPIRSFGLLLLAIAFSACELLESGDRFEKTFPDAADYQQLPLQTLIGYDASPGRYNVEGYIVYMNICPPDARCYGADGIALGATKRARFAEETLHLDVNQPRQFELKERYVLSVEVEDAGWEYPDTGKPARYVRLIGYSKVK